MSDTTTELRDLDELRSKKKFLVCYKMTIQVSNRARFKLRECIYEVYKGELVEK